MGEKIGIFDSLRVVAGWVDVHCTQPGPYVHTVDGSANGGESQIFSLHIHDLHLTHIPLIYTVGTYCKY